MDEDLFTPLGPRIDAGLAGSCHGRTARDRKSGPGGLASRFRAIRFRQICASLQTLDKKRHHHKSKEISMIREGRNRPLVEAIDNAIEQAEDLGLTFIASIRMMARLEADQSIVMTRARRSRDEHA